MKITGKHLNRNLWIEISRSSLFHNLNIIQKITDKKEMICMVKGNAYGHGSVQVSKLLEEYGVSYLGVVCIAEAQELRAAGIKMPILLINEIGVDNIENAIALNATITIMDRKMLIALQKIAKSKNKVVKIHVHIDTGMHREGIWPVQAGVDLVVEASKLSNIELEGIYTHFATSEEYGNKFTLLQLEIFDNCLTFIEKLGVALPKYIHSANSGAILNFSNSHSLHSRFTATRPGIALYGLYEGAQKYMFKSVLSLKARISQIKTISKGQTVGYAQTWKANRTTKIGLITIGYGDGISRKLSNTGNVLVHGQRVKMIGRISMDQTVIQLQGNETYHVGDEVVIIGKQKNTKISVQEIAKSIDTITNEIVANLNPKRIQRFIVN